MTDKVSMVGVRDGWPGQPIRDADDGAGCVRLQRRQKWLRQTLILESFARRNLNCDFFDVEIRCVVEW